MAEIDEIDYGQIALQADAPPSKATPKQLRFVRAYATTFQVIFSYLFLFFLKKLRGQAYFEAKLEEVNRKNARRVQEALSSLQGLFIKVGQLLSILTNILPPAFREEIEKLQDKITPKPYTEIAMRIISELGSEPEEVFKQFDKKPIASASLGQVHKAVLKSGEEVAVKVQHWGIEKLVRKDLKTIRRILKIIQFFFPIRGMEEYYKQIRNMIYEELDFEREAENIKKIAANFKGNDRVHFPQVFDEYSTKRVLTMKFVRGIKVTNLKALNEKKIDRRQLVTLIVTTYCQMIFVDGVYHADPHPGNIFVHDDGSITFLDFGAISVLSEEMKEGIPEFLEGLIKRNTNQLLRSLRKMGFIARAGSEEVSEKIIEYFHRRFQEEIKIESFNLKDVKIDPEASLETLFDLRKMNIGIRELTDSFRVPKDWVLLERCILLLFGLVYYLDPEVNPTSIIYPYLKDFVFGKEKDWQSIILNSIKEIALSYLALPQEIRKVVDKLNRGELKVTVKGSDARARYYHSLGRQFIYAAFSITGWASALYFHSRDMITPFAVCCGFGGWFFLMMISSAIAGRKYKKHL